MIPHQTIRPLDALLLLMVTFFWGSNFVVMKWALDAFEPMLLALIRFALSAVPMVFVLRRPAVPWWVLVFNGVAVGAGQFGLLFWALKADISPGMASLLMQTQVFITIVLAGIWFKEHISRLQIAGLLIASAGLATVGLHIDRSLTALGLCAVLAASFFWACSNLVTKHAARGSAQKIDMLAFIAWSSLFAVPPLLLFTLLAQSPAAIGAQLSHAGSLHWAAAIWQAAGNTLIGFGIWGAMLTRYSASVVTPWALLVPVFGMGSSALLMGEAFPPWKILVFVLVMGGLVVANGAALGFRRALV